MRIALTLSLLALAVLAPAAQAATGETRIIVGRDPGLTAAERADIRQAANVDLVRTLRIPNTEVVATDTPKASLADLRRDPDVRYAEIDHRRHALVDPNDSDFHFQWGLENTGTNISHDYGVPDGTVDADMDVPEAWAQSTGSGVTVAVADTGVMTTHPDLVGHIAALSRNFVGTGTSYADGDGHGTHVSGIIAATRGNGVGIAGIAPDAKLAELRVLDNTGSGYDSDIASAFDYAGAHGIRIVNASLGGTDGDGTVLRDAIVAHPNTLYVVAAGNSGSDNETTPTWPCNVAAANLICVGASTYTDDMADFSNYGVASVDLFAPGKWIWSTVLGGGTDYMSGTSMASPAVAAEAALVLAANPALTTAQVKAAILGTAEAKPAFAGKSVTGGRANAAAAVAQVAPANPPDDDGDGIPNAADSTPRGPDPDGDGVGNLDDACPTRYATTPNGCPAAPPAPAPAPPAPAPAPTTSTPPVPQPTAAPVSGDRDGDGRVDPLDACPSEAAATRDGCPVPALRSLSVKTTKRARRVRVRVRADRAATITFKVERRACTRKHGRQRCRWRIAATDAAASLNGKAAFSRRLAHGRYRVSVRLSSNAGTGRLNRKYFRL